MDASRRLIAEGLSVRESAERVGVSYHEARSLIQRQHGHRCHDPGFLDALPKIERVAGEEPVGFWHVYRDGKIKRMWP